MPRLACVACSTASSSTGSFAAAPFASSATGRALAALASSHTAKNQVARLVALKRGGVARIVQPDDGRLALRFAFHQEDRAGAGTEVDGLDGDRTRPNPRLTACRSRGIPGHVVRPGAFMRG